MKDNLEVKSRQDRGVPIGEDRHTMAYISYQLNHYKRLDELVECLELLEPQLVTKEQVCSKNVPTCAILPIFRFIQ